MISIKPLTNRKLLNVIPLVIAIFIASIGTFYDWWNLRIPIGPFYLGHLFGIIGASWIAIFTPIFVLLRRRSPQYSKMLVDIHVTGNLIAFLIFSMHFWQQVGRPADYYPELGTGLSLYMILTTITVTGLLIRFRIWQRLSKSLRTTHVGLVASFYIVLTIHVLRNVGIL